MKRKLLIFLMVICISAMLVSCGGNTPSGDTAADPSAAPTAEVTAEPTSGASPAPKLLLTSKPFESSFQEMEINAGTIRYDANILDLDLESAELDGCFVPVQLRIDAEQALDNELFKEANRILTEPEYFEFVTEREAWCNERRWNPTEEDEKALENASGEEKDAYFFKLFEEYWRGNHTEEEFAVVEDTLKRYNEAMERYNELKKHGDDWKALYKKCIQTELERLGSKGVVILGEWQQDSIYYALIPIERLRDFPENHRYGYGVMWFDEGILQQSEWAELMKEHGFEELLENVKVI